MGFQGRKPWHQATFDEDTPVRRQSDSERRYYERVDRLFRQAFDDLRPLYDGKDW